MKWLGIAVVFCAALSLVAMDDAVARGGGGRSSGGASRGGSHSGNHSHHNHHRSHGSFFVGFGAPLFWGPSYYYYAPGYYEPLPVYIEQNPASPEQGSQYWYYCPSARTYYPYVGECPEGWQRVLPEANPQPTNPQPPAG